MQNDTNSPCFAGISLLPTRLYKNSKKLITESKNHKIKLDNMPIIMIAIMYRGKLGGG